MKVWAKNEIISIAIFSPADCIVFFNLFQPLLRTVPCSAEKEECIVLPTMADYLPFVRKQDTPNLPVLHNKHCRKQKALSKRIPLFITSEVFGSISNRVF